MYTESRMHREHNDARANDDDSDDVGDDVGGYFLSPVRRRACSPKKTRQRQRLSSADALTLAAKAGRISLSPESAGCGHSC